MGTAGIFPFKDNSHDRAGNRTRHLMISNQRLWPLDHEAGLSFQCSVKNLAGQPLWLGVVGRRKHFSPRPEPPLGSAIHLSLVPKLRFISGAMPLLLLALMEWTRETFLLGGRHDNCWAANSPGINTVIVGSLVTEIICQIRGFSLKPSLFWDFHAEWMCR